jgi:hypothetical protein
VFQKVSARSGLIHKLFLPDSFAIEYGFHLRSAAALLSLTSSFIVAVIHPVVQIGLQLFD